jgi:selenium metabolism protein YedF
MELRKLLDAGTRGVVLHVADELARSNVTRFGQSRGAAVRSEDHPQGGFLVHVEVPAGVDAGNTTGDQELATTCDVSAPAAQPGPQVIQVTSPTMGQGNDELGSLLLRGFLKTLPNVTPRPQVVVCYNSGVTLCCVGSPVLEELRALVASGATVLACGTCLNYLKLADQLAVGRVTDMLEITTVLSTAGRVVRP